MNAHNDMTLRDWFAGMAMQGIVTSATNLDMGNGLLDLALPSEVSSSAYEYADAMLAERELRAQ